MINAALADVGVLVTRPRLQAGGLIKAIENEGGNAVCLPVIEIVPRDQSLVEASLSELAEPDIVIFVSSNAVEHGLRYVSNAKIGAIGPATAAAVQAAGHTAGGLVTEAAIAGGITGGGEVAISTAGEGVRQAAGRLFSRLQSHYTPFAHVDPG